MTSAEQIALAALRYGPLDLDAGHLCWRFGNRRFAFKTVAKLIAAGLAVRLGNTVRLAT